MSASLIPANEEKIRRCGSLETKDPIGVDLSDVRGLDFANNGTGKPLMQEAKTVLDHYGTKGDKSDIKLIFVKAIYLPPGGTGGAAIVDSYHGGADNDYAYNAFIDGTVALTAPNASIRYIGYVAAHELCHLLLDDPFHPSEDPWNLMDSNPVPNKGVFSSKQLHQEQEIILLQNSHAR